MLPELKDVIPSPEWLSAWEGYALDRLSRGLSRASIKVRQSTVLIMARWATRYGHEPSEITRRHPQNYPLAQYRDRKGCGQSVMHPDLRCFWRWFSAEYETVNPWTASSGLIELYLPAATSHPGPRRRICSARARARRLVRRPLIICRGSLSPAIWLELLAAGGARGSVSARAHSACRLGRQAAPGFRPVVLPPRRPFIRILPELDHWALPNRADFHVYRRPVVGRRFRRDAKS